MLSCYPLLFFTNSRIALPKTSIIIAETNTIKTMTVGRLLAVLVGLFGLWIISTALWSIWCTLHRNEAFSLILIVFSALIAFLGGCCIFVAVQAWLNMSAKVAINSLLGIAKRKMADYKRDSNNSLKYVAVEELKRLIGRGVM